MSEGKLPYCYLAIPYEMLTEEFLNDPSMIRFVVWMMSRIRCFSTEIPLKSHRKHLLLEPFEFMFGRYSCTEDAHITPAVARNRLSQLVGLEYVEKVTSKSTSQYSVYRLVTTAFKQSHNHQNNQHEGSQTRKQSNHKRNTKKEEDIDKKGAFNEPKTSVRSSLSESQKDDLKVLLAYFQSNDLRIYEQSLIRWISQYEVKRITSNIALLIPKKDSIKNHEAWMEKALKEDYAQKNDNISINQKYINKFKREKQWKDIKITQRYCVHEPSGKDYQFTLPPDNFSKLIIECFEQYRGFN